MGKSRNGTPIQSIPSAAIAGRSTRATLPLAFGKSARVMIPKMMRTIAMVAGAKDRRAISIHMKDEPHIKAVAARSSQSVSEKACVEVTGSATASGLADKGGAENGEDLAAVLVELRWTDTGHARELVEVAWLQVCDRLEGRIVEHDVRRYVVRL